MSFESVNTPAVTTHIRALGRRLAEYYGASDSVASAGDPAAGGPRGFKVVSHVHPPVGDSFTSGGKLHKCPPGVLTQGSVCKKQAPDGGVRDLLQERILEELKTGYVEGRTEGEASVTQAKASPSFAIRGKTRVFSQLSI